jgi:hypothetical protein
MIQAMTLWLPDEYNSPEHSNYLKAFPADKVKLVRMQSPASSLVLFKPCEGIFVLPEYHADGTRALVRHSWPLFFHTSSIKMKRFCAPRRTVRTRLCTKVDKSVPFSYLTRFSARLL